MNCHNDEARSSAGTGTKGGLGLWGKAVQG